MKTQYRGFEIAVRPEEQWTAEIIRSSTGRSWCHRPTVPLGEGSQACVQQAQRLVDAFIALKGHD